MGWTLYAVKASIGAPLLLERSCRFHPVCSAVRGKSEGYNIIMVGELRIGFSLFQNTSKAKKKQHACCLYAYTRELRSGALLSAVTKPQKLGYRSLSLSLHTYIPIVHFIMQNQNAAMD